MDQVVPPEVDLLEFADDVALLIKGANLQQMIDSANSTLDHITEWMAENNLSLSPNKSSAILFTKSIRLPPNLPNVYVNNTVIPWSPVLKYLGVIFDSKLTWRPQVEYTSTKALKSLNIIRYLSKTWWGAHPSTSLLFYKALVRSHLDYGLYMLSKVYYLQTRYGSTSGPATIPGMYEIYTDKYPDI